MIELLAIAKLNSEHIGKLNSYTENCVHVSERDGRRIALLLELKTETYTSFVSIFQISLLIIRVFYKEMLDYLDSTQGLSP